jgi:serine/threonine protein kinase
MRSSVVEPDVDRDAEWIIGEPLPGTRWVVQGRLGHGGMGIVLQVCKSPAGIHGAMKVMRPALAHESSWTRQFLAEARLLASVQHPNIVEVIDYDTLADGTPFLVMALLHGQTLRGCMRAARADGLTVTGRNVFAVVSQLGEGLRVLHSQRVPVVHGDVKPENIFLQDAEHMPGSNVVKLLDFGLARAAGRESRSLLGTPRYMAPEQLRGEAVSERADQYSAALVTYEMLTGQFPWDVSARDVDAMIEAHLMREPAPPSTFCPWVPPDVDRAIVRALAKDPADRWASVAELVERLRELKRVDGGSAYVNGEVDAIVPTIRTSLAAHTTEPTGAPEDVLCSTVPGRAPSEVMRMASAKGSGDRKGPSRAPRALARKAVDSPAAWALLVLVAIAIVGVETNAIERSGDGLAPGASRRSRAPESHLDSAPAALERPGSDAEMMTPRIEAARADVVSSAASSLHPTARPEAVTDRSRSASGVGTKRPPSDDADEWKRSMDDSPPKAREANETTGDERDPFVVPLRVSR